MAQMFWGKFLTIACLGLGIATANAQTPTGFPRGAVIKADQLNAAFSRKQDYPNIGAGCNGTFAAGTICNNPQNSSAIPIPTQNPVLGSGGIQGTITLNPGNTPGLLANGQIWVTNLGVFAQVNGSTVALGGAATFADPSALVGLTPVNGTALTGIRSDGAPALSQSIVPTWTGFHTFSAGGASVTPSLGDNTTKIATTAFVQAAFANSFANPTATIGLTAVNGVSTFALRSDSAPALSQAIVPTWTGLHTFSVGFSSAAPVTFSSITGSNQCLQVNSSGALSGTGSACSAITTFANPTATIGLTVVNGVATTAMRSDSAPVLSQSIVPTWTGIHTWTQSGKFIGSNTTGLTTDFGQLVVQNSATTASGVYSGVNPFIWSDGVRSTVVIPNGTTVGAGTAFGAYVLNQQASAGNTQNGVLYWGQGISAVDNAKTWGFNPGLNDTTNNASTATSGRTLIGMEFDCTLATNNSGSGCQGISLIINGLFSEQSSVAGVGGNAMQISSGASSTAHWLNGFVLDDGGVVSTNFGMIIGATAKSGGTINSYPVKFNWRDSGSVLRSGSLQVSSSGNISWTCSPCGGIFIGNGFQSLSATVAPGGSAVLIGNSTVAAGSGTCPTGTVGGQTVLGCLVVGIGANTRNVPFF